MTSITKIEGVLIVLLIASLAVSGVSLNTSLSLSDRVAVLEGIGSTKKIKVVNAWTTQTPQTDPMINSLTVTVNFMTNVYDFLVDFDLNEPPKTIPALAISWNVLDDDLTYAFHLREDVKFHSGNEFTAEDVKYSMDRMLNLKLGFDYLWSGFIEAGDTEVVDDYTVEFHLKQSYVPFTETLCFLPIYDSKLMVEHTSTEGPYGEFGDYGSDWLLEGHDAGCGPYILTECIPMQRHTWSKFDDYWRGWEANQITEIDTLVIPEEATYKLLMETGRITVSDIARTNEFVEYFSTSPNHVVLSSDPKAGYAYRMNLNCKKLDVHLRKALAYIMDTTVWIEDILKKKLGEEAMPINGPLAPFYLESIDDELFCYSMHNVEKAKEELALSSYNGEELVMRQGRSATYQNIGFLLQSCAAEIGVNIKFVDWPTSVLLDKISSWETSPDIFVWAIPPPVPDPDVELYSQFHSVPDGSATASIGPMHYENARVDELLEDARATSDPVERAEMYKEVQQIIHEEVPCIFGVLSTSQMVMDRHLQHTLTSTLTKRFDFYWFTYTD